MNPMIYLASILLFLLFVFQMTGAKDRMRQKKMKNQPRNVTYSSTGDVHIVFASIRCCSDVHEVSIICRSQCWKRSGVTGQWLGQRSSDWQSGLQSRSAQIHHRWASRISDLIQESSFLYNETHLTVCASVYTLNPDSSGSSSVYAVFTVWDPV